MDETAAFIELHLQKYRNHLSPDLSSETARHKVGHARRFLEHLAAIGMTGLTDIDPDVVYEYVGSLAIAPQTRSGVQFDLREMFDVLFEAGLATLRGRDLFPVICTNKRDRILSFYTPEEVGDIVAQVDISSPNGVRDKCMVLLAAQAGLRTGDILGLRLSEVKWSRATIEKPQSKTGLPVSVPLPENVLLLLADYVRNHRPASESEYVFVNPTTGTRLSDGRLYSIMRRLVAKSGVVPGDRKHGPHALRHSLATTLLGEGAPLPVISGILGHRSTQTTRMYLGVDVESLRRLSLEVPGNGR